MNTIGIVGEPVRGNVSPADTCATAGSAGGSLAVGGVTATDVVECACDVVFGAAVVVVVARGAPLGGVVVAGATVVGATVVGATVVGAAVVGATVVGATVVGGTVVGGTVVGGAVVGAAVVGATVVGSVVVPPGSGRVIARKA
jgi:hypothetical protein